MVILEYKDEMHDLFWLGNKFRGGICMNCYKTIRERTAYVREHCLFSSDVSGFSAQWETEEEDTGEEFTFLKADRNSLKSDDFRILLCVYDHRGIEWSISPLGMRRMKRQLPRRGWFHRHEYVEILYVIEGSFDQFLLGERYHFPQGCFVITDQNCEHSDYIDAVDAAVLFLQTIWMNCSAVIRKRMSCIDFFFMHYASRSGNRVFLLLLMRRWERQARREKICRCCSCWNRLHRKIWDVCPDMSMCGWGCLSGFCGGCVRITLLSVTAAAGKAGNRLFFMNWNVISAFMMRKSVFRNWNMSFITVGTILTLYYRNIGGRRFGNIFRQSVLTMRCSC